MKKILSIFLFVFLSILTACKNDSTNENNTSDTNITMTYVASYSKTAGPMGTIVGGHLIEFYKDNTLTIFAGFSSAVGEAQIAYDGTYTLNNNELVINYKYDDIETTITTTIQNETFRCQIFMIQSMPDDGADENIKGLTYYKVDSKEYHKLSRVYIGTYLDSNGFKAYTLELKSDNTFELISNLNGTALKANGKYEIIIKSIDEVDEIKFIYDVLASNNSILKKDFEVSYEYSTETKFRFEYLYNTLESINTTQLVYIK